MTKVKSKNIKIWNSTTVIIWSIFFIYKAVFLYKKKKKISKLNWNSALAIATESNWYVLLIL